jgi:RHS repeat-associated protein
MERQHHFHHRSTRQLIATDGSTVDESFSYDAYGVMLGGNPGAGSSPATNLLYCGEYFDTDMQQYYLRARWYDQQTGRFNHPFAGNNQEPQSLHKYLYVHSNPVNNIDPTGKSLITNVTVTMAITAILFSANIANAPGPGDPTSADRSGDMVLDMGFALLTVGVCYVGGRFIVAPLAAKLRGLGKIFQGKVKLPPRLARVVSGKVDDIAQLGKPGATDVFVTSADDIGRISNADDLASAVSKKLV